MIMKISRYGDTVLDQQGDWVEKDYKGLTELVSDMYDTMSGAGGIGLAAQQVGVPIKLFVTCFKDINKAYLNSEIIETGDEIIKSEEGCLSIPGLRVEIERFNKIKVLYEDENFNQHEEWLEGYESVVFQHEHDHTEGTVFTNYLSPLKKKMIQKKLNLIINRKVVTHYPMA